MEMNGWDVVSLVTVPFINAAIHREGGSPTKMQLSTDTMAVQAEFGSWQITVGGAANMLMFDIPLSYIRGRVTKDRQTIAHFSYQSLAARVQLVLKFVNGKEKSHDLVVDPTNPPTSLVSLMDANGRPLPSAIDKAFITEALTTWLDGNLSEFDHVFASVELDPGVGSDTQWAFCKPSVVVYTYVSGRSLADSYLGILYNTAGRSTPGSVAQIDPSFIPAGCQAAFMLSPTMFITDFLGPAARQQFGIPAQSLKVDTSQLTVALNAGESIPLPEVPVEEPAGSSRVGVLIAEVLQGFLDVAGKAFAHPQKVYKPYLVDLQIAVQNSVIKTYSKTSTIVLDEFYGTVTAFNESESWMTLGLDASREALTYTNTQPPINNHHTEQSISFTIIQDILQALGIVTIVIAAVLTDGAALLAIGALSGVASGGAQWALASFESDHRNDAPEINNLVSNLTLPVRWSRTGPFATTQAGLHQGGFFLAGTIRQDEKQT
ncbi:hypothetical protein FOMG_04504 [Fusarium oxysporum f. sp. melonis 26406]|uniref:Protein OrfX2/OrfX3/P47 domain-containing protein n=1 Tax=Fusarium oxysporum f. sp. melonis 26406 TaxID=1089452 RepID=X0A9X4_FUSOX|nr:hypothetical protein FOMG_04504 [Fusarium oxysporum f. sp. melonis 26406]